MATPQQGNGATRPDRGRGYRQIDGGIVEVYDLDMASYLSMRDLALAESYRYEREFVFRFQDPEGRIAKLTIEYVNSEAARFADAQRRLKKVIISRPAQW